MIGCAGRLVRQTVDRALCARLGHDPSRWLAEALGLPGPICTRCRQHCPPGQR